MQYLKIDPVLFQQKIGHNFSDLTLLQHAITHPSYLSKQEIAFFERLEFLGDKVLGLAITEKLITEFATENEGKIAVRYTNLTNKNSLYDNIIRLGIDHDIELMPDCKTVSVYADIMEAILGAIFIDAGYETARDLIFKWFDVSHSDGKNAKNILQEYLQSKKMSVPTYEEVLSQKDYFEIRAIAKELGLSAIGFGHNKKLAEQDAAKNLLALISKE